MSLFILRCQLPTLTLTHLHTTSYINFGLAFCNEDFELFAIGVYTKLHGRRAAQAMTKISAGAIVRYKKQWGFGSKRPRISHLAKNPHLAEQMVAYRQECKKWLKIVGPSLFMNFDETFWRLLQNVLTCWGTIGEKTHLVQNWDPKAGVTLGFTVAADGTILPTLLIRKGKTKKVIENVNLERFNGRMVGCWTASGWMRATIMIDILLMKI